MSLFRIIQEWFTPPEAAIIARQYRESAKDIRLIQKSIKESKSILESNWVGKAQQNFLGDLGNLPNDIGSLADRLEEMADEITHFKVSIDIKQIFDEILGWINYE
jgi:uncharacterized protein YukE